MTKKSQHCPFDLPIPGYGTRKMTHADFVQTCEREGITITRRRFTSTVRGCYLRVNGQPHITIDSRLRGTKRTSVEFHELGHYFLHDQKESLMRKMDSTAKHTAAQRWAEVEADAVALVAVAPDFHLDDALDVLAPIAARRSWKRGGA